MAGPSESAEEIQHLINSNCNTPEFAPHHNAEDLEDFRPALLKFMATATPNSAVASNILKNFDQLKDQMTIVPTNHFAPGESPVSFLVDNVPDAVDTVKAKLAYQQVPNKAGDATELHLVWKVCRIH